MPPALILIVGGFLLLGLKGSGRKAAALALPLVALAAVWLAPDGVSASWRFLDYMVEPLQADRLSRLFGTVFSIMAFAGALFSLNQESRIELPAAFVYAGGALGVVFAGDLMTLFVFWELMALASTAVIWAAGERAAPAALRYVLMHLLGGVLLMAGIAAHVTETGSADFVAMRLDGLGAWLILAGFLVNVAAPPVSSWLSDAYPEATWSGTVFLSAFTTKTAVYVLLRGFPGTELLIWVGAFMIFYGIIMALLENDMRRILAYSIVNQVGFMVVGCGIGTEMAINGAAAHAFAHIIYKALLLMSAGSVLLMTGGVRRCSDLGGLFKSMPYTAAMGIVGALAISAFPFTSGFVSKSMINQAAADEHLIWVWLALVAASAGVFLHAGIKFPWFVFFQKDSGLRPAEPPLNMRLAMGLFAVLCVGLGVFPQPLYALLPFPVDYAPYTFEHVVSMLQLLLFSGLAFFLLLPLMKRTLTITLDFDWLWRRLLGAAAREAQGRSTEAFAGAEGDVRGRFHRLLSSLAHHHGPHGALSRDWPTGSMALWATALLAVALILYFR